MTTSIQHRRAARRTLKIIGAIGAGVLAAAFGAKAVGAADPVSIAKPVGLVATPTGAGYWLAASDGGIFAFGDATFQGSMGGRPLNAPVAGITATPTGRGYWLTASDGGIFAFGDATFQGSMGGRPLNAPVVGITATPTGRGYWLTASDGGIFAFGDATFQGNMGGRPLNAPVVGITATPTGRGYWLTASDGGIFAFGDATFQGSMGGHPLNAPVVGMARTQSGAGYRQVAADGGVFSFGDATSQGSLAGQPLAAPIIGTAAIKGGFWLVGRDGGVFAFGSARYYGRVVYSAADPDGSATPVDRGYASILPRSLLSTAALTNAHHDYPAIDIQVPVGNPFYAITSGTATTFDQPAGCGYGVQLAGDDGGLYVYCHASARTVQSGSRVSAGTRLGSTGGKRGAAGAGSSTGPHLHLQLKYPAGTRRCPQNLLLAIYNGSRPPSLAGLPTSGCSY